jgi:putative tryptophan/tyrosine transport system substrate-binding protein
MRRRDLFTLIGGGVAAWPLAARAQSVPKRRLIAWITGVTQATSSPSIDAFLKGMRELGHIEGSDFDMVYRFSDGYEERLPSLAEEVVRLNPDVILATAIDTAVAVRKLTSTIPIVSGRACRRSSSRLDSERGAARGQRHRNRTIRGRIAR